MRDDATVCANGTVDGSQPDAMSLMTGAWTLQNDMRACEQKGTGGSGTLVAKLSGGKGKDD
jgi:hypothetical protein